MSLTTSQRSRPTLTAVFFRPEEAAEVLRLSRSVVFELLRCGRLRSVKEGRARLIPAAAITEYAALLEREAQGER